MDVERLKELREETEQYRAVADDRYMLQDLVGDEINRLMEPCEWCEGNVSKYFDVNWYDFTAGNIGVRPQAKFCPNCGQAIDWSERSMNLENFNSELKKFFDEPEAEKRNLRKRK